MNTHHTYDTIIIGGGPAGSTVATLVAEHGHRVLLLERATIPQFKIGESLIPATYWTFKRLGMLEKLRDQPFPTEVQRPILFAQRQRLHAVLLFPNQSAHESAVTWQVLRSEFDQMLLGQRQRKRRRSPPRRRCARSRL